MVIGAKCKGFWKEYRLQTEVGMKIKINMVVQKGKNEQDILQMAQYFKENKHILRFIEYMDVGNYNGWDLKEVVSKQEIVDTIHQVMPLERIEANYSGEVATRYRYIGSDEEIGIISSVTDSFAHHVRELVFLQKENYILAYLLLKEMI